MKTALDRTRQAWSDMRYRCRNPHYSGWKNYGGRGITFCAEWESFDNFVRDMGIRPDGMTLERGDVNGNYEPSNCKWASNLDQQRNRRDCVKITANGVTKTMQEWADDYGVDRMAIRWRINHGYTPEEAVTRPFKKVVFK